MTGLAKATGVAALCLAVPTVTAGREEIATPLDVACKAARYVAGFAAQRRCDGQLEAHGTDLAGHDPRPEVVG